MKALLFLHLGASSDRPLYTPHPRPSTKLPSTQSSTIAVPSGLETSDVAQAKACLKPSPDGRDHRDEATGAPRHAAAAGCTPPRYLSPTSAVLCGRVVAACGRQYVGHTHIVAHTPGRRSDGAGVQSRGQGRCMQCPLCTPSENNFSPQLRIF